MTEAAAGDRWSERMNREPDSHAQLSAGSKRGRLTPGQRDMERERDRQRRRDDGKIEGSFQIAAGLTVCTESFSGEGEPFFRNRDSACSVFITGHNITVVNRLFPSDLARFVE